MRGNITRRGKSSWRLKFNSEADAITGKRRTRYVTVRGKRQEAERELARLLNEMNNGTLIEPSKLTVAEHIRAWLESANGLSPKTAERYRQLTEQQIIPHLGNVPLQKLRPAQVAAWHSTILKRGGENGRPLSARTVGHAHRVLRRGLQAAVETETLSRNVASSIRPPKVEKREIEILKPGEIATLLAKLEEHELYPIATIAVCTGLRRGELLALRSCDVDLKGSVVKVERSLEESDKGLRIKPPKTQAGRRQVPLPPTALAALEAHRARQAALRLALGQGKPEPDALVFCTLEGGPLSPDDLSRNWSHRRLGVSFHALRHTYASVLIDAGLDVLTVSRRLGHGSPATTLNVYGHLFRVDDKAATAAIEAAMGSV